MSNLQGRLKALEESTAHLLKTREVVTAECAGGLTPLVVCHHPQLPETPLEEIDAARSARRLILHLRMERTAKGRLLARVQREQEPYLVWSSEGNAPSTTETIYDIEDGSKRVETVASRYGAGCRVMYAEEART
jgi:hypothetical protein